MDWTTLIVGLGSILLGAFSTYLAFKDRTSSFQENIHTRQVIDNINSERIKLIKESRRIVGTDELSNKNIKLFKGSDEISKIFSKFAGFSSEIIKNKNS